jgi:hypothetical protein
LQEMERGFARNQSQRSATDPNPTGFADSSRRWSPSDTSGNEGNGGPWTWSNAIYRA